MKYIVFCVVFAALVAVSVADNLLAESTSSEQVSLLSRKGKLERARVAKKMSKGNAEASEDDGTELIELEETLRLGLRRWTLQRWTLQRWTQQQTQETKKNT